VITQPETFAEALGLAVRRWRKDQGDGFQLRGVSQPTLSRIENGKKVALASVYALLGDDFMVVLAAAEKHYLTVTRGKSA
jgi:transcriptional regulator with XRE-family HTH domain